MARPSFTDLLQRHGRHNQGDSLFLTVRGPKSARWEFKMRVAGTLKSFWLGSAIGPAAIGLTQARELRAQVWLEQRGKVAATATPRQAASMPAGRTFREVLEAWLAANSTSWAAKSTKARGTLAALSFADRDIAKITQADVLDALAGETPRQHMEKRGWLAACFAFARAQQWRTGDNPATFDKDMLRGFAKIEKGKHHARVSRDDVPALYVSIVDGDTARALRLLILTAARAGDVEGATWSEIHPKGATFVNADGDDEKLVCDAWIIPAERAKERKRRIVPLPSQAMAILGERGAANALLFGKLASNAMLNLLQKTHPDKTVHGMRSTFRDWAIRQSVPNLTHGATVRDLAELQQGHNLPGASAVEKSYARDGLYDLRAPLMQQWAAFATGN